MNPLPLKNNQNKPLQIIGITNAYLALLAENAGFQALYLSGAGVANASFGWPDIGVITLNDILVEAEKITQASTLPLLVDIDTGGESLEQTARITRGLEKCGAAGLQIEDQTSPKRCGHLPGKQLASSEEMAARLKIIVENRETCAFSIVARTDAYASEGLEGCIQRALLYKEAGADILFPEALPSLKEYTQLKEAVGLPVLANLTEFGVSPLFTLAELEKASVDLALYPLTLMRVMNRAAKETLEEIATKGTQQGLLDKMETRQELYQTLKYNPEEKHE